MVGAISIHCLGLDGQQYIKKFNKVLIWAADFIKPTRMFGFHPISCELQLCYSQLELKPKLAMFPNFKTFHFR